MPLLEVNGLAKAYGRRRVVDGVSFHVDAGEAVGLLGPNGAGKTTSFRMTTGMVSPDAGTVTFAGQDVTHWPMYKRARLGLGYLSQESSIFRKLSVEQNVLAILEAIPASRTLGRKLTRKERHDRTDDVLEQFGLTRLRKSQAATLSGGEKRRLEIARCLVCEPRLILLDEPFTGIDPITINDIQGIVRDLRARGIGMLLTDHNVREALKITDRSYLIKDGKVRVEGTPPELVNHPVAIQEYLGQTFVDDGFIRPLEPAEAPPRPPRVHDVLEQERIQLLVEHLKADPAGAERELVRLGRPVLYALTEAMERRDLQLRCLAHQAFEKIAGGPVDFDSYAPEAVRRQQLAQLREQFFRKAG